MNISFSAEHEAFRDEVRRFLDDNLTDDLREAQRFCPGIFLDYEHNIVWHRILHRQGWIAPSWPKEYGGTGWDLTRRYIWTRESTLAGAPSLAPMGIGMCGPMLIGYGTQAQKDYYLPRILSGEDYWCQGYSEPGSGSDLASLKLRADVDGDHYVLNGSKIWTTHAHYANRMFCLVRTGRFDRPQQGVTFLLIDLDTPGVSRHPIRFFSGDTEQCQVVFDNVRVPQENVVGREHEGWTVTKYLLEFERGGGASAPGLLESIGDLKRFAAEAGADDLMPRVLALETRVLALEAIELRCLAEAERTGSPGPSASMLKVQSTELSQALSGLALEACGWYGLPWQPEVVDARGAAEPVGPAAAVTRATFYFNNRAASIYGGSNEIQRNIMSRHVLGL